MRKKIPSWPLALIVLAGLAAAPKPPAAPAAPAAPEAPALPKVKKRAKSPNAEKPLNYGKFNIKGGIKLPSPPPPETAPKPSN